MKNVLSRTLLFILVSGLTTFLLATSLEETFKKQISADDFKLVSVLNQNGSVEVKGWSKDQIEIIAYKKVRAGSQEKAEKLMEYLEINIDESGDHLVIETIQPRRHKDKDSGFISWLLGLGNHANASVDYMIKVPHKMDLDLNSTNGGITVIECEGVIDLKTTNGKIVADNIKGSTNCKTTNGSIKAYLDDVYPKEDMTFKSTNGSIKIYLPGDTNADVEAKTTNGSIRCDLPLHSTNKQSKHHFYGEINDGGSLIYIKTTNGSIKIYEN